MSLDIYTNKLYTPITFEWHPWLTMVTHTPLRCDGLFNNSTIAAAVLDDCQEQIKAACANHIIDESSFKDIVHNFEEAIILRNRFSHVFLDPGENIYFDTGADGAGKHTSIGGYHIWIALIDYTTLLYYLITLEYHQKLSSEISRFTALENIEQSRQLLLAVAENMEHTIQLSCNLIEVSMRRYYKQVESETNNENK